MELTFFGNPHIFDFDFFRSNLDYLVDEVCFILRMIRRENASNVSSNSASRLTDTHDDRIIRVVGSVFFEIQQHGLDCNGSNIENDSRVVMLLRDLIQDSLDVIDLLCNTSTEYAQIDNFNSKYSLNYQHGQRLLGPLLGLMHSLILRFNRGDNSLTIIEQYLQSLVSPHNIIHHQFALNYFHTHSTPFLQYQPQLLILFQISTRILKSQSHELNVSVNH